MVCQQLGCRGPIFVPAKLRRKFTPGDGRIWLDDVHCKGHEQSLEQCQHRSWGYHDCNHKEDVVVFCSGKPCRLNPLGLAWREVRSGWWGVNSEGKGYSTSAEQLPIIVTYFVILQGITRDS